MPNTYFGDMLHDWQQHYLALMPEVLRNNRDICLYFAKQARGTAQNYLEGKGVLGIGYAKPHTRRTVLYFGARYALTLAAILELIDWDAK